MSPQVKPVHVHPCLTQQHNLVGARNEPSLERLSAHLEPQVVFRLVGHLSVVVGDVALADEAVDGALVGVGTVPQHPPVMQPQLVLGGWSQTREGEGRGREQERERERVKAFR